MLGCHRSWSQGHRDTMVALKGLLAFPCNCFKNHEHPSTPGIHSHLFRTYSTDDGRMSCTLTGFCEELVGAPSSHVGIRICPSLLSASIGSGQTQATARARAGSLQVAAAFVAPCGTAVLEREDRGSRQRLTCTTRFVHLTNTTGASIPAFHSEWAT